VCASQSWLTRVGEVHLPCCISFSSLPILEFLLLFVGFESFQLYLRWLRHLGLNLGPWVSPFFKIAIPIPVWHNKPLNTTQDVLMLGVKIFHSKATFRGCSTFSQEPQPSKGKGTFPRFHFHLYAFRFEPSPSYEQHLPASVLATECLWNTESRARYRQITP
jgi:hypothetical protein